ncbi:HlyD family efflux transporter periplasmic adaptor subunit [Olivibacter sp. CPCC 100613]|uniref:HlyD family secretion protein n=1 Tax=Olivibacter sp. CPCC 100613 TaxID=3079931 RepID=UPI002FFB0ACB
MPVDKKKIEQISDRSEFFEDILDRVPPQLVTWGSSGILVIFLIVGLGLRMIKYPEVITSETIITNDSPPIEVYSRSNGRISHLLKKDKETVKKGDWIMIINNNSNHEDVLEVMGLVDSLKGRDFWAYWKDAELTRPYVLGDVQSSFSEFSRSLIEFYAYNNTRFKESLYKINRKRQEELLSKKAFLENQLQLANKELEIKKRDFDRTNLLYERKVISLAELEEKQLLLINSQSRVDGVKESLVNISLEDQVLEKEIHSSDLENDDRYLKLRNDILQNFANLEFSLSEWKNKYVITAPVNGRIDLSDFRNENKYVTGEKRVLTITPVNATKYFSLVKLPTENSGKVRKGQDCVIKLKNYPYEQFGMLKGRVTSISLNANDGFYTAVVDLPRQLLTTQKKNLSIGGDVSGTAEIIIEDLSLFDRLFYSLIRRNY